MELGIGMFGDNVYDKSSNTFQSAGSRLKEIIDEVKYADELGIDFFAMGEHHREDYSVSAPEIILSAISSITKNILLSSGVNVLSSADPVKLYQDYSMLDLMSDQRAEIMVGRGSFIESFPLFGQDLKDYHELFTEKLDLLLNIRKNKEVSWKGEFRSPIHKQTVYPRPNREIPIWIAVGGTPASVERAGRLGLPIIFAIIGGQWRQFQKLVDYYKETYLTHGHDPKEMKIGVHAHTYIGKDNESILKNYFPQYAHQMDKIGRERGWNNTYTQQQFTYGMNENGALFMGTPQEVANKIIDIIETFNLTRFVAHLDTGGPMHEELMQVIELLGKEVYPIVRKHFSVK